VSRLCAEIDERVNAFLFRPLEGAWPYLWLDATYLKVRESSRIVSRAVIVAVAVNEDGGSVLNSVYLAWPMQFQILKRLGARRTLWRTGFGRQTIL